MTDPEALIDAARRAAAHAHAPYSRFAVGAALLLTDGSVVTGTNFENASYGLSLCAETVATATANASGRLGDIVAVGIVGGRMGEGDTDPIRPCGRCRQVLNEAALVLERKRRLPNIIVGYLNQGGPESPMLYRFRFGLSLPVWGWVASSRINAAKTDVEIAKSQIKLNNYELQGDYDKGYADLLQYTEAVDYYETIGLRQADEIVRAAGDGYRLGSIGYYDYLLNVQQAFKIRFGYLEALRNYNQAVITLNYLKGE